MAAEEVRSLKEAFVLFSPLTNMPYVECEEENYNDQTRLFADRKDAEADVEILAQSGIRAIVRELKTVEMAAPAKAAAPGGAKRKLYLNQVRQHLSTLPFLGINAVRYQPAGASAQTILLTELLPEDFEKKVEGNSFYQPTLQLTGLYLMQEARRRREDVDRKHLQELDEEFSSNLVKSRLFLAVLPPEGMEKEPKLDLRKCRLPVLKRQDRDPLVPVFTDIWEFQKYAKGNQALRPVQIPFTELPKFRMNGAKAYLLNPLGYALPLKQEIIPGILKKFGVSETPS